ncbi:MULTISPECIES: DUF397 domain-containing protein [Frankia]|uniref:Regulatory protein (Partial) n=1 Tax=Frankia alni (strain DSM 45986 / CECT 9034 / ACN14a) TaxID=326424 RepID=Q0REH6_FRAAA|nr:MULTISPECIES: DUF397 domain-containing protein [Frankia]CAJ64134.1 Putative regulatory protein (partial) [Frankia alni ACN14a]
MLPTDPAGLVWRKSRASNSSNCVEVAIVPGHVLIRDSKNPGGGMLSFTEAEWAAFLVGARAGEFDLPEV